MARGKHPCGNPLFLTWMEELRDQARERGTKAFETYSKACRSLASCPVTYSRPRELVCLNGIGPKTVTILEGKYRKYCEENDIAVPSTPQKAQGKTRPADSGGEASSNEASPPPARKKRATAAKKPPKVYIPARGSGGYGILLSLLLAIDRPHATTQVFLTKSEIIRGAQPFSDASYEHAEKGTYFTAWSGMKTLVGRGYVYVTGNPQKFCLTEEGYDVACAIRALLPDYAHVEKMPFLHEPNEGPSTLPPVLRRASTSTLQQLPSPPASRSSKEASVQPRPRTSTGRFQFWYIDSAGNRVLALASASVRLDPEEYVNLRKVEFVEEQRTHPFVNQLRLVDADASCRSGEQRKTAYGFIREEGAPPQCSGFAEERQMSSVAIGKRKEAPLEAEVDDDFIPPTTSPPRTQRVTASVPLAEHRELRSPSTFPNVSSASIAGEGAESIIPNASATKPSRTRSAISLPTRPRLSSHVPAPNPLLDPSASLVDPSLNALVNPLPSFNPTRDVLNFLPGTYDIYLILDTREVESKASRDKIQEALEKRGVKLETRALRLGDVCWVARRRDGLGGEEDECVLDYVVERKRLDDLCSSMRDGRYHDQCFRLANSKISNVFYIVEDFQNAHHMEVSGQQINTAKSQIQLHNGFYLKETHRLSETIDYLATLTDIIASTVHKSPLRVIPTRHLSRSSYGLLQDYLRADQPGETYLTSFEAYQELNDKSASKTLRDRWARMLMCVKGMSAERVSAVLDLWETPRALWEDMQSWERECEAVEKAHEGGQATTVEKTKAKGAKASGPKGKEAFFAERVKGEGRRKIGDALSKELWRMLMGSTVERDGAVLGGQ